MVQTEHMLISSKNFDPLKMSTLNELKNTLLLKKKELVIRIIGNLENILWQVNDDQTQIIGATSLRNIVESC